MVYTIKHKQSFIHLIIIIIIKGNIISCHVFGYRKDFNHQLVKGHVEYYQGLYQFSIAHRLTPI